MQEKNLPPAEALQLRRIVHDGSSCVALGMGQKPSVPVPRAGFYSRRGLGQAQSDAPPAVQPLLSLAVGLGTVERAWGLPALPVVSMVAVLCPGQVPNAVRGVRDSMGLFGQTCLLRMGGHAVPTRGVPRKHQSTDGIRNCNPLPENLRGGEGRVLS